MAKKKVHHHHHSHEEAPHSDTHPGHHHPNPNPMDQDDSASSEKLESLKSLNAMLLKETYERRHQVDSLERAKNALESQLARFGGEKEALEAELGRAGRESVGLALEKGVICAFLETQMVEIGARVERLVKRRDAEVDGLRERVRVLVDSLEKERVVLSDVSGERDLAKAESAGLVEKANLLKESLSEMEKVRRNLEGSFERLKLQNEKLVREKEEGERAIEAVTRERDSAKNSLAQAGIEASELKGRVEELVRVNKGLEMGENGQLVEMNELEKEMAVLNEVVVSLRREEGKLRERVSELENKCDAAIEKEKEMVGRINGLSEENQEKGETIDKLREKNNSAERLLKVAEKKLEEKERLMEGIVRKKLEIEEANYCKQNEIAGLLREVGELKNEITRLEFSLRDQVDKNKALISELSSCREASDRVTLERDTVQKALDEEKQNALNLRSAASEMKSRVDETVEELMHIRSERENLVLQNKSVQSKFELSEKEKELLEKKVSDAQRTIEDLEAKISSAGIKLERTLAAVLKRTAAVVNPVQDETNGREEAFEEQKLEEDFQPLARELEAIKSAFLIKESLVEDLNWQMKLLQDSAAKAHKEKGFWTLLSSATTLLAAASVAYFARGR
ncbi:spindle pole body component 110-like [Rhodamnia argentea]|uniref:Spindle pole body component 110-like n=1 Tax=Rhodamnia argentea TaxID=178133 RepID=A0A8B8QEF0_9MYRT|nr:spindle pole body component 110-like [Rhodamnia argentea]